MDKNYNKLLFMVFGGRGNVGKTTFFTSYIDYLFTNGYFNLEAFDTDTTSYKAYTTLKDTLCPKNHHEGTPEEYNITPVMHNDYDQILEKLNEDGINFVAVDSPASGYLDLAVWLNNIGGNNFIKEMKTKKVAVVICFMIENESDSVQMLDHGVETIVGDNVYWLGIYNRGAIKGIKKTQARPNITSVYVVNNKAESDPFYLYRQTNTYKKLLALDSRYYELEFTDLSTYEINITNELKSWIEKNNINTNTPLESIKYANMVDLCFGLCVSPYKFLKEGDSIYKEIISPIRMRLRASLVAMENSFNLLTEYLLGIVNIQG